MVHEYFAETLLCIIYCAKCWILWWVWLGGGHVEGSKNEYNLVFVFKRTYNLMKNSDMLSSGTGKQIKGPRERKVKTPNEGDRKTVCSV